MAYLAEEGHRDCGLLNVEGGSVYVQLSLSGYRTTLQDRKRIFGYTKRLRPLQSSQRRRPTKLLLGRNPEVFVPDLF